MMNKHSLTHCSLSQNICSSGLVAGCCNVFSILQLQKEKECLWLRTRQWLRELELFSLAEGSRETW